MRLFAERRQALTQLDDIKVFLFPRQTGGGTKTYSPAAWLTERREMADLPDRDKLLRNFGRCANWEEKYLYIIELGQRLPPLSEEAHNPDSPE